MSNENAEETAFPFQSANNEYIPHRGLSKREYFAAMYMQGLAGNSSNKWTLVQKAKEATQAADELLKQLSQ